MLRLRIVRGPLSPCENETILNHYNDLTASKIPLHEFLHWVQEGPLGPAWHGVLEYQGGVIAGHTCLLPLRAFYKGKEAVAAKAEYSFVLESARAERIQGVEKSARPKFIVMTDELFRHCRGEGWGPFLMWPPPPMLRFAGSVGCTAVDFPFTDCLLILRPRHTAHETPNLSRDRRAVLSLAALVQRPIWSIAANIASNFGEVRPAGLDSRAPDQNRVSFFCDSDSNAWRYLPGQYTIIGGHGEHSGSTVVKNGSAERFLRVCQFEMDGRPVSFPLVAAMVRLALKQKAIGLRWCIYGRDAKAQALVSRLQRFGFLCVPRTRNLMIYTNWPELKNSVNWNLLDSIFSFDP